MAYELEITNVWTPRRIIVLAVSAVLIIATMVCSGKLVESMDASEIMVVQAPMSGKLTWYTTPGIKWQGFGDITTYRKRGQFWFSSAPDEGGKENGSIRARFNDGAHGNISGSLAYELSLDEKQLTDMHCKYRTPEALQQQLIRPLVEKSVYLTGPQMSSKESIAEKRNELLFLFEDQIQNGVYRTETVQEQQPDPITHQLKTVSVVKLAKNKEGKLIRADVSPLNEFGIKVFNLSLKEIKYDDEIEAQIKQQQEATMQVQLAIAKAKEAEQRAVTTEKEGQANASKAKWEQETIKIRAVTEGEQKLAVAELDTKAAEQFKLAETLRGEGEAARRRAAMDADGSLDKRLSAFVEVNRNYAEALKNHQGPLVPSVVMGGGSGNQPSNLQSLMDLFTAKTAKDLALDMSMNIPSRGNQIASKQ